MKSEIFLLNTSYRYSDNGTIVQLWGRSRKGRLTCLEDDSFSPYFYLSNLNNTIVRSLNKMEEITDIVKTRLKKRSGEYFDVWKVTVRFPKDISALRKTIDSFVGVEVYRADVVYTLNYLYDKGLGPRIRGIGAMTNDYTMRCGRVESSTSDFVPDFSIMSWDIENFINTAENPDKNIICVGVFWKGEKYIFSIDDPKIKDRKDNIFIYPNEIEMLKGFIEFINKEDPDILIGYNCDEYDWLHLEARCNFLNIPIAIGRNGGNLYIREKRDKEGNVRHDVKIHGRVSLDVWKLVRKYLKPIDERLGAVGVQLGLGDKEDIDSSQIDKHWKRDPQAVLEYCMRDAELCYRILDNQKYVDNILALASASDLPFEDAKESISSRMVDSQMIRSYSANDYAIPMNNFDNEDDNDIEGAFVAEPISGLHRNISCLDFKSLYPSIMIEYNISWETLMDDFPEIPDEKCNIVEWEEDVENDFGDVVDVVRHRHRFLKKEYQEGLLPKIMTRLMDARVEAKKRRKGKNYEYYNRLQDAIKILMNSFFGNMASNFYRFTDKAIGASITAWARDNITAARDRVEEMGYKVLYIDTDSIFCDTKSFTVKEAARIMSNLANKLSSGNLILEAEKVYSVWFSHGKKKYYAGAIEWKDGEMLDKPQIDVKGYAIRRRDSCTEQRDYLNRTVEAITSDVNMDKYWKSVYDSLKLENFSPNFENLVFTRSCRDPEHYKYPERIPQYKARLKMEAKGIPVFDGMRISYVVTSHGSPLEVDPIIEGEPRPEPDLKYYRDSIIRKLAGTKRDPGISTIWGWDHRALKNGMKKTSLEDF